MNGCKYYKQEEQVSYDNKQTWESTGNYRKGELYESYSPDCAEQQRWTLVPGGYICENGSKYQKLISEISDDGINYKIKYPAEYSKGALIETDSAECDYKWYGHYKVGGVPPVQGVIDPIKIVLCSGSSEALTSTDIEYQTDYAVISGYVGGCVSSITNKIFSGQTTLEYLDISDTNISVINSSEFRDCYALTNINLPNSLTSIGVYAFSDCSGLTSIVIPDSVTSIGEGAFSSCRGLTSIVIPDSVTNIHSNAFSNCSGLTSVTFGNNLNFIGAFAFERCIGLTSAAIPNSVTEIDQGAFGHCSGLTSITIGTGVTDIDMFAFEYCTSLESVTIYATWPPDLGGGAFDHTNNCPIYVPANSVNTYKTAEGWSTYASRIFPIQT